ncbi:MAG: DNA translocase FtsK [Candidatus Niyogibacteria bacterium]|nr:DNA translocase FtsK [Candidatus Niyogibacteria bacterium]
MAKNKNKKEPEGPAWHNNLKPETKRSVWAIASFAIAAVFTLAAFGKAGFVGSKLYAFFTLLFGDAFFLIPLALTLAGFSLLLATDDKAIAKNVVIGGILFVLSALGVTEVIFGEKTGGYVGFLTAYPIQKLLDFWASLVVFAALVVAALLIMLNIHIPFRFKRGKEKIAEDNKTMLLSEIKNYAEDEKKKQMSALASETETVKNKEKDGGEKNEDEDKSWIPKFIRSKKSDKAAPHIPFDLLEGDRGKPQGGDIKANSNIIKRTLQNFGIDVEMGEVSVGPSVTQYTLRPAEGVKLSKILALQNDLSLALAAHPLRIEAPIPGKSLAGIEIPNKSIATVGLKSLLSSDEFTGSPASLLMALGRKVSGDGLFADLTKMPHLLIAGSTGSGKSVCLHSLLVSLLYKNSPDDLKLLLIDPKRVELTNYEDIPHLLSPVIMDAKKAIMALRWAAKEMERRYEILFAHRTRDLLTYHEKIKNDENADPLPFIVIIIDELADIMAAYPRELEAAIVRLAQMSRAVGIHLIVSTQRPSVEVITGLIKANITSRIAFRVASQVDSRTILDMGGADKLLGNGDMLFLAGDVAKPVRVQGAFVGANEVKRVVEFLRTEYEGAADSELKFEVDDANKMPELDGMDMAEDDELYEEARDLVMQAGKASTSYLQRRLRLGYARAARLMDILEDRGVVGPADGSKPRDVLMQSGSSESGDNQSSLNNI